MDYYSKSYCCPENLAITIPKLEFSGLESFNATIKLNYNYMEFLGPKACDKLMWSSGIVDTKTKIYNKKETYQLI